MKRNYKILIGIDSGVNTGIAIYVCGSRQLHSAASTTIHEAMEQVRYWNKCYPGGVLVRVEDARKRTWFGKATKEVLQGAGSIKRDAKIWDDFLRDLKVDYEMVAPKNNKTKLSASVFAKLTGFKGSTNEHSRDASMLVFGY